MRIVPSGRRWSVRSTGSTQLFYSTYFLPVYFFLPTPQQMARFLKMKARFCLPNARLAYEGLLFLLFIILILSFTVSHIAHII